MIAIDTQVMIWGFKRTATPNRQHMLAKAAELFRQISEQRDRILIPSLVVSEALVKYSDADRAAVLAAIGKRFFIAPFDARATTIAARLYADEATWKASRAAVGNTRQCIKVDISILATVAAFNIHTFYVEDDPLFDLAKRYASKTNVMPKRLPDVPPKQIELFEES
jgi:predicted nucleic acid-binding protein